MKMEHHFNTDVAKIVGLNAAVVFYNIQFWCDKNQKNGNNFFDGEYWTYNSMKAFCEQFEYLSKKQITAALEKLKHFGFIGFGEYNQNPYDRTRWYCDLTQKVGLNMFLSNIPKGEMEITKRGNVEDYKRGTSITDNKTDSKPNNKQLNNITGNSSGEQKKELTLRQLMIEFWLKEFHVDWNFNATDGKKMDSIIKKLKRSLSSKKPDFKEIEVLDLFKVFCHKLPDFYKTKNLSVLDSNYDSIIEEIKNNSNGKTTAKTTIQSTREASREWADYARKLRNNSN